jgi:putative phosphoribosyl transferase
MEREVLISADGARLPGTLDVPPGAQGVVVFAHGSGSSRLSPRNREVAAVLSSTGRLGTLLFDLLTPLEDLEYARRFDIRLLVSRLAAATRWLREDRQYGGLRIGYFGASTGAAAALGAAAADPEIAAIVSRGGRPDLAGDALARVTAPTLLIVGGLDTEVIGLNREALLRMASANKRLEIVPGATHLFDEPGTLGEVARLSEAWFERYLATPDA